MYATIEICQQQAIVCSVGNKTRGGTHCWSAIWPSVWALEGDEVTDFICQANQPDARGWLQEAFTQLRQEEVIRVVVTVWTIWCARRKAIHENQFQSPMSTHCFVNRFLTDLELSMPKSKDRKETQVHHPCWIAPPQGMMKINVDATLSKKLKFGDDGCCCA